MEMQPKTVANSGTQATEDIDSGLTLCKSNSEEITRIKQRCAHHILREELVARMYKKNLVRQTKQVINEQKSHSNYPKHMYGVE